MTPTSADTAELTRLRPDAVALPVLRPPAPVPSGLAPPPPVDEVRAVVPAPAPSRVEVVAERRQARRHRRLLAASGLAVLAGTLGAAVAVLDVLH
ncbi:MAG TPA: hypothetical protein VK277_04825 [Acidimicrobiales bacterium]|nr:hypothetical protein [Acidimicrobiales bacterium]